MVDYLTVPATAKNASNLKSYTKEDVAKVSPASLRPGWLPRVGPAPDKQV